MDQTPSSPFVAAAPRLHVLICVLGLAACSDGGRPSPPASVKPEPTSAAAPPSPPVAESPPPAPDDEEEVARLRRQAAKAMAEQRLYSPSADNALEHYLALREKRPDDAMVLSALTDLMPYVMIAIEQEIAHRDISEARRLYGLMVRVDPQAPALPRLDEAINGAQAKLVAAAAALESSPPAEPAIQIRDRAPARRETPAAAKASPAANPKPEPKAPPPVSPSPLAPAVAPVDEDRVTAVDVEPRRRASDRGASSSSPAPSQAKPKGVEKAPSSPAPPSATPAAVPTLRALRTPAPEYPPGALGSGVSGKVVVEFTVTPQGGVRDVRVVRSNPPRIFDQATVMAVRRWRFAPIAAAVQTQRTVNFTPSE